MASVYSASDNAVMIPMCSLVLRNFDHGNRKHGWYVAIWEVNDWGKWVFEIRTEKEKLFQMTGINIRSTHLVSLIMDTNNDVLTFILKVAIFHNVDSVSRRFPHCFHRMPLSGFKQGRTSYRWHRKSRTFNGPIRRVYE